MGLIAAGRLAGLLVAGLACGFPGAAVARPDFPLPEWCKELIPLSPDLAQVAKDKAIGDYYEGSTPIEGPVLGGKMGCAETLDEDETKILIIKSEDFDIRGVKGRAIYQPKSIAVALQEGRTPRRTDFLPYWGDLTCYHDADAKRFRGCVTPIDDGREFQVMGSYDGGLQAGMIVGVALFPKQATPIDGDKPLRLSHSSGAAIEVSWQGSRFSGDADRLRASFSGAEFHEFLNSAEKGGEMRLTAFYRDSDKPVWLAIDSAQVMGPLNAALALAEALAMAQQEK